MKIILTHSVSQNLPFRPEYFLRILEITENGVGAHLIKYLFVSATTSWGRAAKTLRLCGGGWKAREISRAGMGGEGGGGAVGGETPPQLSLPGYFSDGAEVSPPSDLCN